MNTFDEFVNNLGLNIKELSSEAITALEISFNYLKTHKQAVEFYAGVDSE